MGDFKMGNNTVLTQSGTANPTWGAGVPKGSVIEQFMSPCDGSAITVQSGTYTVGNVTTHDSGTSSWQDISGSSITYTPPTGTQTVIYEFGFQLTYGDPKHMGSFRLFIDSNEATKARFTDNLQTSGYLEHRFQFKWAFHIGGSADTTSGRQSSWSSGKEIKMQFYEYDGSHEFILHKTGHWETSGTDQLSVPTIGITALA